VKKLRIDMYCGYTENKSFTEHDCFKQLEGETVDDFIARISETLFENIEQLTFEDEGHDED
jgi:hypothetical protein